MVKTFFEMNIAYDKNVKYIDLHINLCENLLEQVFYPGPSKTSVHSLH